MSAVWLRDSAGQPSQPKGLQPVRIYLMLYGFKYFKNDSAQRDSPPRAAEQLVCQPGTDWQLSSVAPARPEGQPSEAGESM